MPGVRVDPGDRVLSSGPALRWRIRAVLLTALVAPLLELVSFARVARWLAGDPLHPAFDASGLDDAALAGWVDRVQGHLPGPWRRTCLRRCAVLYALLRRAGRPVELWIGVRRDAPATPVVAHAWLVLNGRPYLEPEPDHPGRHTPIAHFPGDVTA